MPTLNESGLSSPWEGIHHRLLALFADDDTVKVAEKITDDYVLNIVVYDTNKYNALCRRLRQQYTFGNVTLTIALYDAANNEDDEISEVKDLETILNGNKYFDRIESIKDFMGFEHNYCIFSREIMQYFNDNCCDPNGNEFKLMQDLAPVIFNTNTVNWTTESE